MLCWIMICSHTRIADAEEEEEEEEEGSEEGVGGKALSLSPSMSSKSMNGWRSIPSTWKELTHHQYHGNSM